MLPVAHVNGTPIAYEERGFGRPVILLHGNNGHSSHLKETADRLVAAGYRTYALNSRGQGANAPVAEYHYTDMGEDLYQFIQHLNLRRPAIFGWSDGGIISLQMEILHPGTAGLIITSGANTYPEGVGTDWLEEQKRLYPNAPSLQRMMYYEPHITHQQLATIHCPSLICGGEHDIIPEWHTREIASHIPHAQLLIIPGEDHGSHIWQNTRMGDIIVDFLLRNSY